MSACIKKNKIKKDEQTHRSIIGGRPFDQFHYSCTCSVVFHVPERKFHAISISSGLCYRLITRTKKEKDKNKDPRFTLVTRIKTHYT